MPLLEIKNLHVRYGLTSRPVHAVRGVDLTISKGEIVGLVGESGCGKSAVAQSILKLERDAKLEGDIFFKSDNLMKMRDKDLSKVRGSQIAMMFQDSYAALNPTQSIGDQMIESMVKYDGIEKDRAFQKGVQLLFDLGVNLPALRMRQFPHQLSGGIMQRVMMAIAIARHPQLLIADEPTTSLDVITQAQILQLLAHLNLSVLFITHDLSLISQIADRVYVMYAGKILEENAPSELFSRPRHPYTKALLASTPHLKRESFPLEVVPGSPPSPFRIPSGCSFHPRCPHAMKVCAELDPGKESDLPTPCWLYHRFAESHPL